MIEDDIRKLDFYFDLLIFIIEPLIIIFQRLRELLDINLFYFISEKADQPILLNLSQGFIIQESWDLDKRIVLERDESTHEGAPLHDFLAAWTHNNLEVSFFDISLDPATAFQRKRHSSEAKYSVAVQWLVKAIEQKFIVDVLDLNLEAVMGLSRRFVLDYWKRKS